jgi:D-alanine-D-alanine ligase
MRAAAPGTTAAPPRLAVAVLAGGRSSEHEVSLSSAASIEEGLRAGGHDVLVVEIGRDGRWRQEGRPLAVVPGEGLLGADVVFPALHGPFGEDGTVQGMLETLDVAYVGSGVAASALCMDKVLFKRLMATTGTPQVDHVGVGLEDYRHSHEDALARIARLGLPVFVKPAHLGSSVGIAKVAAAEELEGALERAFVHDSLVIVEAAAAGLEVECGVLGTLAAERAAGTSPAVASQPGEIVLAGEWYDYTAKYSPGGMELRVPARISATAVERVREEAVRAFLACGCDGLARADFFVDGETVLLNELNTMPGFTPTSVYAKLLDASGIGYPALVERLCLLAYERHERRRVEIG